MPVRALLADPNQVARGGLRALMDQDPRFEVVGEAAHDFVAAIRRVMPDVTVLDPALHGDIDLDLLANLTRDVRPSRICVYTSVFEPETHLAAMQRGIHGYLLKGSDDEALLDLLASIGRFGTIVISPTAAAYFDQHGAEQPLVTMPERPAWLDQLTPREYETLSLVAADLTDDEIGARLHVSAKTVGGHLRHVMEKIGVQTRVRLGIVAHRAGFGTDRQPTRAARR